MNVYATNNVSAGYEFAGSYQSLKEAQEWASVRGDEYAVWWDDSGDDEAPEWARIPCDV